MPKSAKVSPEVFRKLYAQLNVEQKAAVDALEGPVLVVAGPGTGKTQVLTMRIANILQKTDTPSSAILALTFTESGVRAMRERLLSIIGPEAYYVNICTFHSFCSDILKANADRFVVAEDLEPLSDLERVQVFREILDEGSFRHIKPFGSPYYYVKALVKTIQDLKREGVSPAEFKKFVETTKAEDFPKLLEVCEAYAAYQKKVAEKSRYDFEDMINLVTETLANDESLLRDYQEKYLYVLIDEYQDTNSPQNKVVMLLASYWGENANVFAVGDDAQSIYRFQGASLENILFFTKNFPSAELITLKKNYRSQKTIIDAAEDVIANNEVQLSRVIKNLKKDQVPAQNFEETPLEVGHFSSGTTESFFVGQKIKKLLASGVKPSEVAVIYRNNVDSKDFADMLGRMGINFRVVGGENVLEDHDISKLLKLFEVILKVRTKEEDLDLFTVFNYEFLGFDYLDTLRLSRFASDRKINFVEAIRDEKLAVGDPKKFTDFLEKVDRWQTVDANETFVSFFEKVLEESGFLNWVLKSPDSVQKLNKLNSLFAEIKRLNIADHGLNLQKFMENVGILRESGISINEEDINLGGSEVLLTTAHRAKGLEFEHVFIVKCFDGKWGNKKVRELIRIPDGLVERSLGADLPDIKKEQNEDERRLFYVAATRAKRGLYITYADSYFSGGFSKEAVPSMFISEIGSDKKIEVDVCKYESAVKEILKDILKPVAKNVPSSDEKNFLENVMRDMSLSVTALNTYLECAYKFKLNNLLRTPRAKDKYLALGTAVHRALELFFRQFMAQGKILPVGILLKHFDRALKEEILTPKEAKECDEKGHRILKEYYEKYYKEFTKPLFAEKFFGYGYSRIYFDDVPLVGKVDRIDLVDPKKKLVKVVDYKTGKPKSRAEIEGKTKYSRGDYKRQLVFYKLLADLDKSFNFTVSQAELDFIEADKTGKFTRESFEILPAEVEELKLTIKNVVKKVREFDFNRTTDYKACVNCEFKAHCWPDGIPLKEPVQEGLF